MKQLLPLIAALGLSLSMGMVHAADKEKTPQQMKMAACNKDATGKKGAERKTFMKSCLSATPDLPAAAAMPASGPAAMPADAGSGPKSAQRDRMAACNGESKGKKGDERKKFMSECLKG